MGKVVALKEKKQPKQELGLLDKVNQVRCKHLFLSIALPITLDTDNYAENEDFTNGIHFLMSDIQGELDGIFKELETRDKEV